MADKRLCFFIGEIGATKTPERARANWLLNEIIEPVIASYFPEFEVRRSPMVLSPEEAQQQILNELTNADLVIADDYVRTQYDLSDRNAAHNQASNCPYYLN
jgi:hypothetical protein